MKKLIIIILDLLLISGCYSINNNYKYYDYEPPKVERIYDSHGSRIGTIRDYGSSKRIYDSKGRLKAVVRK